DAHLHSPFWALAATKYHHILVTPSGAVTSIQPLGYWGAHHGIGTNAVGVGRYPGPDYFVPISLGRIVALCHDQPDKDAIFVVPYDNMFRLYCSVLSRVHGVGVIDGYNIIAPYWFKDHAPGDVPGLRPGESKQ